MMRVDFVVDRTRMWGTLIRSALLSVRMLVMLLLYVDGVQE